MAKKNSKDVKVRIGKKTKRSIPRSKLKADRKIQKLADKANAATEALAAAVRQAKKHDRRISKLAARLEAELKKARKQASRAQESIDKARKAEKKADRKLKAAIDAELKRLARAERRKQRKAEKKAEKENRLQAGKAKRRKEKKQQKAVARMISKRQPVALLNGNLSGKGRKKKGNSLRKLSSKKLIKAAGKLKLDPIKGSRKDRQLRKLKYKGSNAKVILFDMRKLKKDRIPV